MNDPKRNFAKLNLIILQRNCLNNHNKNIFFFSRLDYGLFFLLFDSNQQKIKKPPKKEGSEKSTHCAQTFFSVHANSPWLPYQEGGEQIYCKKGGDRMSSKNIMYNSSLKGVRLVDSKDAWIITKTGKKMLNPKYQFVGKMRMDMPNMIVSASDKKKPTYKEDVGNLNNTAKRQIINHFYDENGKRNKKRVAYFAREKKERN